MSDHQRYTRRNFSEIAGSYDRHAVVAREVGARLLGRLDGLKFFPNRILDLGCGTGKNALALRNRYPRAQIVAMDSAAGMLGQARRQRGRWRRRFELVAGDAGALPLAESSMDLVLASMTLEWCEDLIEVLHALRRVMRPGGLLLIATTGPDTHQEVRQALAGLPSTAAGGRLIHAQHLGDTLVRAGFREPVVDTDWLETTHRHLDGLLGDLRGTGADLPAGIGEKLAGSQATCQAPDGGYRLTWEIVYASAWAPEEGQPVRTAGGEEASVSVHSLGIRRRKPS